MTPYGHLYFSMILSHLQAIEKKKNERVEEKSFPDAKSQSSAKELKVMGRIKDRSDSVSGSTGLNNENFEKDGQGGDSKVSPLADVLILSEVLLDEDNADRPSYLFMYEQV